MPQDEAVAELTRVREPPKSETPETSSGSDSTTRVDPIEAAAESDTNHSGESQSEPSSTGSSLSKTGDIDGRGDNVDMMA